MNIHIVRHLIAEEGMRLEPYTDSLGLWTIGIGHLIDIRKGGRLPNWIRSFPISIDDAEKLLLEDLVDVEWRVSKNIEHWDDYSKVRQAVLLSMAFQMGIGGLLKFKKAISALKDGFYKVAAAEMLDSRWAHQTPKRAARLANAMRSDSAQFLEGQDVAN
jgi:lysozyme